MGTTIGLMKGDTRSLDCSSAAHMVYTWDQKLSHGGDSEPKYIP